MNTYIIILIVLDTLLILPLVISRFRRAFLNHAYEISISYVQRLGFLISINGEVRIGKTSFSSGLKHIIEQIILGKLNKMIDDVRIIFSKLDFNTIDHLIEEWLSNAITSTKQPDLDDLTNQIIEKLQEHYMIKESLIFDFFSNKKATKLILDYILAYYVLNYRFNFVQSKTRFYSHITNTVSFDYIVEHQQIHEAFNKKEYSIYDYMIEMIDEASDEVAASKRFEDVKEEKGDKDYRRKYGHIHQERNWMISTKQDSTDEIARFRRLTQSNIWIPTKVEQRGTSKGIVAVVSMIMNLSMIIYYPLFIFIPFIYQAFKNKVDFQTYQDYRYKKAASFKRNINHFLLHLEWSLFSFGFNKYEIWVYRSADDVGKTEPMDKMHYYIPIIYCFGTYDTHQYKNIQAELLKESQTKATEQNLFTESEYFKKGDENEDDGLDF